MGVYGRGTDSTGDI